VGGRKGKSKRFSVRNLAWGTEEKTKTGWELRKRENQDVSDRTKSKNESGAIRKG